MTARNVHLRAFLSLILVLMLALNAGKPFSVPPAHAQGGTDGREPGQLRTLTDQTDRTTCYQLGQADGAQDQAAGASLNLARFVTPFTEPGHGYSGYSLSFGSPPGTAGSPFQTMMVTEELYDDSHPLATVIIYSGPAAEFTPDFIRMEFPSREDCGAGYNAGYVGRPIAASLVAASLSAAVVQRVPGWIAAGASFTFHAQATGVAASAAPPSPVSSAAATSTMVAIALNASLGAILTDPQGMTLYTRTSDLAGMSTCSGQCAATWPPFQPPTGAMALLSGASGTLGIMTRDDGSLQVTYNGMPLYFYSRDMTAGDTNGQGVGGVWFAATP